MAKNILDEVKKEKIPFDGYEFESADSAYIKTKTHRKKKSFGARLAAGVIPSGSDSIAEVVRKSILILSVVSVIVCSVLIINDAVTETRQTEEDKERIEIKQEVELSGKIPLTVEKIEAVQKQVPGIMDKYVALYDQNPDLVGWIKIADTPIDYPVVQCNDNAFYLYRDFDKKDSKLGCIFADYHVKLKPDSRPNNTVLYGHNIAAGTYFAKLTNYYPRKYGSLDFYLTHPTVTFDTIYEEGTYKIFAGVFTNTEEIHGEVYPYYQKTSFKDSAAFYDFAQNILDRSSFYTDVDLEYGDEILTLSTCYYPLGDNVDTRFVVFARRVREGESAEVDVSKAYVNKSPLFFDYYYLVNGGSWAGRQWDTTLVKGLDEFLAETAQPEQSAEETGD